MVDADATCSFDYDGLGSIGTNTFAGKIGATRFTSLATLKANTTEVHAVQVDMSVFADAVPFPSNPYPPKPVVDLRLAAGSAAFDKGVVLVGLNEGFSGAAPDLGAYELGPTAPVYGPRQGIGTGGSGGTSGAGGTSGGSGGAIGTGGNVGMGGRLGTGGNAAGMGGGAAGTGGSAAGMGGSAAGTGGDSPDGGPTTGRAVGGGCGCSQSGGGGGAASLALMVLMLAVRRARRARPI